MQKYWIGIVSIFSLFWPKSYFNGAVCKIRRDLSQQVAIVTGGNTGIGKQTALELAKQNCTVVIASRDDQKSEEAVQYIKAHSNNKNVESITLDLASKKSIENCVERIKQKYNRVDILINNAGVMAVPERRLTEDGFEFTIGINHFGHFYLTYLLWDLLKKSQQLRIVNLTSLAHIRNPTRRNPYVVMDFDDIHFSKGYSGMQAYSRSKLANVLFTNQLATRLENINPNARVVSLHPGAVRTQLMRYNLTGIASYFVPVLTALVYLFTRSPDQGAQTTIYTIFEQKQKIVNGGYYNDCRLSTKNPEALKDQCQKRLWSLSEQLFNIKFNVC